METAKAREAVIQVKDLYKIYRMGDTKVHALDGVDFEIYRGEFCAITGPSGSGKSTLLNMLAGLEHPTKGEIIIAGKHIEKLNEKQLVAFRRVRVGFIFQSYNLLSTMNALENVALPLSFRGVPKAVRLKQAKKYLQLVGLEKHMKHMPNQMSGGQQQRVGIARALASDPQIIFADEPTGALNRVASEEVMEELTKINQEGTTILLVTHDVKVAAKCKKVLYLVDGNVKGEYNFEKEMKGDLRKREKELNNWLVDMGW